MRYKITNDIARRLERIARQLVEKIPATIVEKKRRYTLTEGQRIIDSQGGNNLFPNGTRIDPLRRYPWPVTIDVDVNHLKRLRKAYKKGGDQAAIDYVEQFLNPNK